MPKTQDTASQKENKNNKNDLFSSAEDINEKSLITFDVCHHRAPPFLVLIADLIVFLILTGVLYFFSSQIIWSLSQLRENIKLIYDGFKLGKFHYDCTIGGSAIQIAECQIYHGFNVFLFYTVTYFLEYTSLIFRSSNIVEIIGRITGLFYMFKLLVSQIPFLFICKSFLRTLFLLRQFVIAVLFRISDLIGFK